ncbi:Hypothetical predicted protein [Mytilus galloprovincialis]|uniref:Uncharacterized protein n=1 Tax=Mytilus galloprovincialis TaxID=29158 RepID=A0A8B6GAS0_MYTGA|nr:Hypothetical predicted protein [Mytilus galloprovincialis]
MIDSPPSVYDVSHPSFLFLRKGKGGGMYPIKRKDKVVWHQEEGGRKGRRKNVIRHKWKEEGQSLKTIARREMDNWMKIQMNQMTDELKAEIRNGNMELKALFNNFKAGELKADQTLKVKAADKTTAHRDETTSDEDEIVNTCIQETLARTQ